MPLTPYSLALILPTLLAAAAQPSGYLIPFGILMSNDLRLSSASDSATVRFFCESASRPVQGTTLHLFLSHSPDLDSDRSFLSVTLNYGILRSIRLSEENSGVTEVIISIPPASLKLENELVFAVEQYGKGKAWTSIGRQSYVAVLTGPAAEVALPAPLVDPHSYRPQAFDVLLPKRAATATLEATALAVANFAARVAPRPVDVGVVDRVTSGRPILAVGSREEHPAIGNGTVFLTADAARSAVGKLVARGRREWKGYIPPSSRFTLEDLGYADLPFTAQNNYTLAIPILSPPDCRFYPGGGTVELSVQASAAGLRVDATLNQSKLGTFALEQMNDSIRIPIPVDALTPVSVLQLVLRGVPESVNQPAKLLAATRFYIPHDYEAALPDLSLLDQGFYPFSITPDLSDTIVLVPERVDHEVFGMLVAFSAALGRVVPSPQLHFRVRRLGEVTAEERSSSNFIFLRRIRTDPPPEAVFASWPIWQGNVPRFAAVVQEAISGWNSSRFAMAVSVAPGDGAGHVRRAFGGPAFASLSGDIAFLDGANVIAHSLSRKRIFRDVSYLRRMEAFFIGRWFALPLVVTVISVVLFAGLRIGLGNYRATLASGPRNPS